MARPLAGFAFFAFLALLAFVSLDWAVAVTWRAATFVAGGLVAAAVARRLVRRKAPKE